MMCKNLTIMFPFRCTTNQYRERAKVRELRRERQVGRKFERV